MWVFFFSQSFSLEGLVLKLKLQYSGHLMWRTKSLEKTLILGKTEGKRRRDNRGWAGWVASLTPCSWLWVNSGRQWRTGKSGMLQFMGLQRVGHDWVTEQQPLFIYPFFYLMGIWFMWVFSFFNHWKYCHDICLYMCLLIHMCKHFSCWAVGYKNDQLTLSAKLYMQTADLLFFQHLTCLGFLTFCYWMSYIYKYKLFKLIITDFEKLILFIGYK